MLAQNNRLLYSTYFAPRGKKRLQSLGNSIAMSYMLPEDKIIGVIGEAGSGKSLIIRGMFPGLDLTNDDGEIHFARLPLMMDHMNGVYKAHTYHVDLRFSMAFHQPFEIADAILGAVSSGCRVVIEHIELIHSALRGVNADLIIGIGDKIIVTRPDVFGPLPQDIADIVHKTIRYRKMAHTAEDIVELVLGEEYGYGTGSYKNADVHHGFLLEFKEKPTFDILDLKAKVRAIISQNLSISYLDEGHILLGDKKVPCTGPRIHVKSTSEIEYFRLLDDFIYNPVDQAYALVGLVGEWLEEGPEDINKLRFV